MYIVTSNSDNLVVDVSEDIAHDVFGNILVHNKTIGYFNDKNKVYEAQQLPEDFDSYRWTYDGVTFERYNEGGEVLE